MSVQGNFRILCRQKNTQHMHDRSAMAMHDKMLAPQAIDKKYTCHMCAVYFCMCAVPNNLLKIRKLHTCFL